MRVLVFTQNDLVKLQTLIDNSQERLKVELRNDILQFKDDILTEIVKLREDVAVVTGYKDQIEDHETRLTTVETKLNSAS